jgi:hypothetical protein
MNPIPPRVNPFVDDVVGQPRTVKYSVPGLNEQPLNKLLAEFERIASGNLPRRPSGDQKAQLVISPDAGLENLICSGDCFRASGSGRP